MRKVQKYALGGYTKLHRMQYHVVVMNAHCVRILKAVSFEVFLG